MISRGVRDLSKSIYFRAGVVRVNVCHYLDHSIALIITSEGLVKYVNITVIASLYNRPGDK